MQFSTKVSSPNRVKTACLVIGIFEDNKLTRSAEVVDRASNGALRSFLRNGDMDGKPGKTRLVYRLPGILAERILLVGIGKEASVSPQGWRECLRAAIKTICETGAKDACFFLTEIAIKRRDNAWKSRHFAIVANESMYRFEVLKSAKLKPSRIQRLDLGLALKNELPNVELGLTQGRAVSAGMTLAKDLGNLPGNICTPTYLAEQARKLGNDLNFDVQVLEKKEMEKLGMGALLSVSHGSRQSPKFIILKYSGTSRKTKPVVLIGKGITFDTGGISLKPGAGMDEMKFDMCGAASVLGVFRATAELHLKLNLVGLIPAVENMPDGAATRPGDIVTSMSGQTIEILNTDAEGRLILSDSLTYAERFDPDAVVDIATLTGACIIALGHIRSGLFSNNEALAKELLAAGEDAWDRAWQLPLGDEYMEDLKSNFADVANVGGRAAGSITAASFLSRFSKKYDWAHLDIAGTAWHSGKAKGASGRPVPLLMSFLTNRYLAK